MAGSKAETWRKSSLVGSVIAAISASLCCILPLVAVAVGASAGAASAVFAKWRPVFLVFSFAMLGLAWFLTYRRAKTECAQDSTCNKKSVPRWNKILLWVATAFALIAAAFPNISSAISKALHSSHSAVTHTANAAILEVKIPTMDCAACAANIEAQVKKLRGVEDADVNFPSKLARIDYDSARISPDQIVAAINATGFPAESTDQKEKR